MGYDVARFQGDVDEDLICPICSGVLEEPVQVGSHLSTDSGCLKASGCSRRLLEVSIHTHTLTAPRAASAELRGSCAVLVAARVRKQQRGQKPEVV